MSQVVYDFSDERYVVTGASSGMGQQVALDLASAGAIVLGIGRNQERLQKLKDKKPDRIITVSLDVCDSEALEVAIAEFVSAHGKLNGGVHAAGIVPLMSIRDYDQKTARQIMDISFWAGMNLLQLVTRSKYGEKGTSTVLFSSVAAERPPRGAFPYAAAKSAVNAALRSVVKEIYTKHHRVNSVLPGWVATPMTENLFIGSKDTDMAKISPLGIGTPQDVSSMVLFLLSSAARWITGSNIVVDGGLLA